MIMLTIYIIGCCLAFILSCMLYKYEEDRLKPLDKILKEQHPQIQMIAPLTIMSWFTVVMMLKNYRKELMSVLKNEK